MHHAALHELIETFEHHRNPANAEQMEKYMRYKFSFLGIRSPDRKKLAMDFNKAVKFDSEVDIAEIIEYLWELPEREYQYVAVDYLVKNKRKLTEDQFDLIEYLLTTKSWWDTVDTIANHLVGSIFSKYPHMIKERGEAWLASGNLWLIRSMILFQLKYKEATDEALLFSIIQQTSHIDTFFIQKAIGWVLREYSKTNPEAVITFMKKNDLSNLAKREGMKYMK